jgi:hypothetical protein
VPTSVASTTLSSSLAQPSIVSRISLTQARIRLRFD